MLAALSTQDPGDDGTMPGIGKAGSRGCGRCALIVSQRIYEDWYMHYDIGAWIILIVLLLLVFKHTRYLNLRLSG
jgi:hypothetical protein